MDSVKCPNCGHEISRMAKYCTNCGFKMDVRITTGYSTKKKAYIRITVGIALIVVAILVVTGRTFGHYLDNMSYYAEQYAGTKSHSSGFLGSNYAFLASRWKEMYDEAVAYIALHGISAAILAICGSIGLRRGIRELNSIKEAERGTH